MQLSTMQAKAMLEHPYFADLDKTKMDSYENPVLLEREAADA